MSEAVRTLPRRAAPSMPWATSRAAPASNWHSFGVFPWSEPSNDLHAWVASPGSRRATDRIRTGVRCRRASRERLLVTPVRKRCPSWIAYNPGPSQSGQANSNSSGVAIQRMTFTINEQKRASTLLIKCFARGRSVGAVWVVCGCLHSGRSAMMYCPPRGSGYSLCLCSPSASVLRALPVDRASSVSTPD